MGERSHNGVSRGLNLLLKLSVPVAVFLGFFVVAGFGGAGVVIVHHFWLAPLAAVSGGAAHRLAGEQKGGINSLLRFEKDRDGAVFSG